MHTFVWTMIILPSFWAVRCEAMLCSTAHNMFTCSLQIQQSSLLLKPVAKAGHCPETQQFRLQDRCWASQTLCTQTPYAPCMASPWSGTVHQDTLPEWFGTEGKDASLDEIHLCSGWRAAPTSKSVERNTSMSSVLQLPYTSLSQVRKHVSLRLFMKLITSLIFAQAILSFWIIQK